MMTRSLMCGVVTVGLVAAVVPVPAQQTTPLLMPGRAYPIESLAKERVVNDQLGGEAVLVIFRPESDTITAFSRQVDGRGLTFERRAQSGDLVDVETGSRWNPYGECLEGELAGSRLKALIGVRQFW